MIRLLRVSMSEAITGMNGKHDQLYLLHQIIPPIHLDQTELVNVHKISTEQRYFL